MSGIHKIKKVKDREKAELILPKSYGIRRQECPGNQWETALKPLR